MAEQGSSRRRSGGSKPKGDASAKAKAERQESEYILLRGVHLRLRVTGAVETIREPRSGAPLADMLVEGEAPQGDATEHLAWLPVRNGDGEPVVFTTVKGKVAAIEQFTGRAPRVGEVVADGQGPKVGLWKAVSLSAWKGGLAFDPPKQVTMFGRTVLDG